MPIIYVKRTLGLEQSNPIKKASRVNTITYHVRAFLAGNASNLYFSSLKTHFYYFIYQLLQNTLHLIIYFTIHFIKIL